ncbi:MAG TPA: 3D domain-containing protein [Limnochordia bacterium]
MAFGRGSTDRPVPRVYQMVATAYTAGEESTGKRPGDPGYGVTASGVRATAGRTVAVDPEVISLGEWLYIEGIGLRRAEDTGGMIRGERIDLFVDDVELARRFGIQTVRVWRLGPML